MVARSEMQPSKAASAATASGARFIAPSERQREPIVAFADLSEQAAEVCQMMGDQVNDVALPLHLAAAFEQARR